MLVLDPQSFARARLAVAIMVLSASRALAASPAYEIDPLGSGSPAEAGDFRPQVSRPAPRQLLTYQEPYAPGTVVVSTSERRLFLVLKDRTAVQYTVGVGRPGLAWSGVMRITRRRAWPDWRPPVEMRQRRPDLPRYMAGGPDNPLGARALYLGSSLYRIHGSNEPETVGQAVSSGCIRMTNEDVIDLYDRVRVGTKVVVLP